MDRPATIGSAYVDENRELAQWKDLAETVRLPLLCGQISPSFEMQKLILERFLAEVCCLGQVKAKDLVALGGSQEN